MRKEQLLHKWDEPDSEPAGLMRYKWIIFNVLSLRAHLSTYANLEVQYYLQWICNDINEISNSHRKAWIFFFMIEQLPS